MYVTSFMHKENPEHPEGFGSVLYPFTDISYRQCSFEETDRYIKIFLFSPWSWVIALNILQKCGVTFI